MTQADESKPQKRACPGPPDMSLGPREELSSGDETDFGDSLLHQRLPAPCFPQLLLIGCSALLCQQLEDGHLLTHARRRFSFPHTLISPKILICIPGNLATGLQVRVPSADLKVVLCVTTVAFCFWIWFTPGFCRLRDELFASRTWSRCDIVLPTRCCSTN